MRMNTPVTNIEQHLKDGHSIVSKTDLQGNIQYVNPYFIEVSGFSRDELIGAPQNIVRHPDMPREAFADLWATIKAGMPWTGLVKNRCKNGDHYWVLANVTPVIENGKAVGYMSVRTRPSRAQVSAAEEFYRRLKDGNAKGMTVRRGKAARTGLAGRIAGLRDMRLGTQIGVSMAFLCLTLIATGAAGLIAMPAGSTAGV